MMSSTIFGSGSWPGPGGGTDAAPAGASAAGFASGFWLSCAWAANASSAARRSAATGRRFMALFYVRPRLRARGEQHAGEDGGDARGVKEGEGFAQHEDRQQRAEGGQQVDGESRRVRAHHGDAAV